MPRLRNATAAGDVFTIRLPRDLVESLRVIAEENGLSVHNYIRMILTKHVKEYQSTNDLTLKIKKS